MVEKILKGEFTWIKTHPDFPEEFTDPTGKVKKSWSATIYPDKDSLELIRELQAIGIKNKLKKDEKGWNARFSRPCEEVRKGKVTKALEPPKVYDADGNLLEGPYANGATGEMKIDFKEGSTTKGKYYSARLEALKLITYNIYDGASKATEVVRPKQENFF